MEEEMSACAQSPSVSGFSVPDQCNANGVYQNVDIDYENVSFTGPQTMSNHENGNTVHTGYQNVDNGFPYMISAECQNMGDQQPQNAHMTTSDHGRLQSVSVSAELNANHCCSSTADEEGSGHSYDSLSSEIRSPQPTDGTQNLMMDEKHTSVNWSGPNPTNTNWSHIGQNIYQNMAHSSTQPAAGPAQNMTHISTQSAADSSYPNYVRIPHGRHVSTSAYVNASIPLQANIQHHNNNNVRNAVQNSATASHPAPNTASHPASNTASHPAPNTASHPAPNTTSHPAPNTVSHPASNTASHLAPNTASHQAPNIASRPVPSTVSHPAPNTASHPAPNTASLLSPHTVSNPASYTVSHPAPNTASHQVQNPASHVPLSAALDPVPSVSSSPASNPTGTRTPSTDSRPDQTAASTVSNTLTNGASGVQCSNTTCVGDCSSQFIVVTNPEPSEGSDPTSDPGYTRDPAAASDSVAQGEVNIVNPSVSSGSTDSSDYSVSPLEYPPDWYVDVHTMRSPDNKILCSPRVLHSTVSCGSAFSQKGVAVLLERMRTSKDSKECDRIRQDLLTRILPDLFEKRQLLELSQVLLHKDQKLQVTAGLCMEKLLLSLQYRDDPSLTEELLVVAQNTQSAFLQTSSDDSQVYPLCYLHLLAVSALLSRCSRPSVDQCAAILQASKQQKKIAKQSSENAKQGMQKALYTFYEHFKDELDKTESYPVWSNWDPSARKNCLNNPSYCVLIVHSFTLLNEVGSCMWNSSQQTLMEALEELYKAPPRAGKHQLHKGARMAFDFLLVRGLVTLLNTAFKEDVPEVGEVQLNYSEPLARFAIGVIRGTADFDERKCLREELKGLTSHSDDHVRKEVSEFLTNNGENMVNLALCTMEKDLWVAGFQRGWPGSAANGSGENSTSTCSWHRICGTFGQKHAVAHVYVPLRARCMGKVKECLLKHSAQAEQCPEKRRLLAEESEKNRRNMDNLKRLSPECPRLLQLWAYKFKPFPYYVTEPVENRRLLGYLIKHRREQRWLGTAVLKHLCLEILEPLVFLARRYIASRSVTTFYMIADPDRNRHNAHGPFSGFLSEKSFIKLADLGLAHQFRNDNSLYNDMEIRPVKDQGLIPVLWTAPEALFDGLHTDRSMVYSLGCVMFELWTHGCQPFTSYQTLSTEEILIQMYSEPSSVSLHQRPCIPDDVYQLIRRCTHPDPSQRPDLQSLRAEIQGLGHQESREDPELVEALSVQDLYPALKPEQIERNHVPETGIPAKLQNLIDEGKRSDLYANTRKSQCFRQDRGAVTEEELYVPDWLRLSHKDDKTVAEEIVYTDFTREIKPSLEANELPGIPKVTDRLKDVDGHLVHEREYPLSTDMLTASTKGWLLEENTCIMNGEYQTPVDVPKYLTAFISLARNVACLHEQGFCHRDIRARNILVDNLTGQTTFARLGRICRLPSTGSPHFVVSDRFPDNMRWSAPEVLISGQYGPENDVFMLGTTFYETFFIREVTERDPDAKQANFAPCSGIPKDQILDFVRGHTPLQPPLRCPDWLYQLILDCRHPDRAKRPNAIHVLARLHDALPRQLGQENQMLPENEMQPLEPFFVTERPDQLVQQVLEQAEGETPPVVFRKKFKQTERFSSAKRFFSRRKRTNTEKIPGTKSKRRTGGFVLQEETCLKTIAESLEGCNLVSKAGQQAVDRRNACAKDNPYERFNRNVLLSRNSPEGSVSPPNSSQNRITSPQNSSREVYVSLQHSLQKENVVFHRQQDKCFSSSESGHTGPDDVDETRVKTLFVEDSQHASAARVCPSSNSARAPRDFRFSRNTSGDIPRLPRRSTNMPKFSRHPAHEGKKAQVNTHNGKLWHPSYLPPGQCSMRVNMYEPASDGSAGSCSYDSVESEHEAGNTDVQKRTKFNPIPPSTQLSGGRKPSTQLSGGRRPPTHLFGGQSGCEQAERSADVDNTLVKELAGNVSCSEAHARLSSLSVSAQTRFAAQSDGLQQTGPRGEANEVYLKESNRDSSQVPNSLKESEPSTGASDFLAVHALSSQTSSTQRPCTPEIPGSQQFFEVTELRVQEEQTLDKFNTESNFLTIAESVSHRMETSHSENAAVEDSANDADISEKATDVLVPRRDSFHEPSEKAEESLVMKYDSLGDVHMQDVYDCLGTQDQSSECSESVVYADATSDAKIYVSKLNFHLDAGTSGQKEFVDSVSAGVGPFTDQHEPMSKGDSIFSQKTNVNHEPMLNHETMSNGDSMSKQKSMNREPMLNHETMLKGDSILNQKPMVDHELTFNRETMLNRETTLNGDSSSPAHDSERPRSVVVVRVHKCQVSEPSHARKDKMHPKRNKHTGRQKHPAQYLTPLPEEDANRVRQTAATEPKTSDRKPRLSTECAEQRHEQCPGHRQSEESVLEDTQYSAIGVHRVTPNDADRHLLSGQPRYRRLMHNGGTQREVLFKTDQNYRHTYNHGKNRVVRNGQGSSDGRFHRETRSLRELTFNSEQATEASSHPEIQTGLSTANPECAQSAHSGSAAEGSHLSHENPVHFEPLPSGFRGQSGHRPLDSDLLCLARYSQGPAEPEGSDCEREESPYEVIPDMGDFFPEREQENPLYDSVSSDA